MNVFRYITDSRCLWTAVGSFGEVRESVTACESGYTASNCIINLVSDIENHENGVFTRKDVITNIAGEEQSIYSLGSKFTLDGGEWEVYTQYNGWQNENVGGFVPLNSSVVSRCTSARSSKDSTPFIALWNKQNERGIAIHLVTDSAWQIRASRVHYKGEASFIEIELGLLPDGLNYKLMPEESLQFSEIIYYEFTSKRDMDCYKLHSYLKKLAPRKNLPIVYNTWLAKFDSFSFAELEEQLLKAKEIGVEYFVIDAGWFGKTKDWWSGRGDWIENKEIGFKGRMHDFSLKVRECGLKFGFWLEPECASSGSDIFKNHPEYFILGNGSYFIDFVNEEAYSYILNTVCSLIDYYGVEYIKFDFNADIKFDIYNSSFIKYAEAHERFILDIRKRFPDIYLENCGAGGARMNIKNGLLYDGFWPSDNENPYDGLRIYKDTLIRMPQQWVECWIAIASIQNATPTYSVASNDKIIACGDAIWNHVIGIHPEFLKGFLLGSPIGFSFDLNSLSDSTFNMLKELISEFKQRREFYKNALAHIIADTESLLAIEYRDDNFSDIEIILFVKKTLQENVTLYPALIGTKIYYDENGNEITGEKLLSDGVDFNIKKSYTSLIYRLRAKE